ncbi:MAG: hypothetical protein MI717_06950 [Spirochaetales bacterium]|nr:hypothetical protein [Spirochaetales bacterium]
MSKSVRNKTTFILLLFVLISCQIVMGASFTEQFFLGLESEMGSTWLRGDSWTQVQDQYGMDGQFSFSGNVQLFVNWEIHQYLYLETSLGLGGSSVQFSNPRIHFEQSVSQPEWSFKVLGGGQISLGPIGLWMTAGPTLTILSGNVNNQQSGQSTSIPASKFYDQTMLWGLLAKAGFRFPMTGGEWILGASISTHLNRYFSSSDLYMSNFSVLIGYRYNLNSLVQEFKKITL